MEAEEPKTKKSKTKNGTSTSSAGYSGSYNRNRIENVPYDYVYTLFNNFKQLPTQQDTPTRP